MGNQEMGKGSKITVTILLVVGFFVIGIFLQEAGVSKTFLALLALGLFYGIRNMFKSNEEEENNELTLNKD
ncbi:MAG: hypothetical protein FH748_16495 [Balneolaceae bacterium]|nr:hypothetical protein [Balneolaceae bacterium]